MTPRKIAILGGGAAALSAAFWLTRQENWQEQYDITLYQVGWRLGGKAASGRNASAWQRNEEHGYHMLFGFYENTFSTMRACYEEWGRSNELPISEFIASTPEDEQRHPKRYAMKRNSLLFLAQDFNGQTHTLDFKFPENSQLPGDGKNVELWSYVEQALEWLWQFGSSEWQKDLVNDAEQFGVPLEGNAPSSGYKFRIARGLAKVLPVVALIRHHMRRLWEQVSDKIASDWNAYRSWILQDFVATTIIGFLEDDIVKNGFDSINHLNFYEWLRKHASVPEGIEITLSSVIIQFAYDACFAYENGDAVSPRTAEKPLSGLPNMEAGTMLRGGMRLFLTYKGSVNWLFQAGAGEILIAPMYEVLVRRGVKFKFFHKVLNLVVPEGKRAIDAIKMERQVTLKHGDYQPLVSVKDLPAWPEEPLYDQIVEGKEIQWRHINLESFWTDWKGTEFTLQRGVDFDEVLLAIPVASFPFIAQDLAKADVRWQQMINHVKSTRTFGFQTWLNKSLEEMCWTKGKILTDTGTEPVGMEADHTQVIEFEEWPVAHTPRNLAYFGGVMPNDPNESPLPNPAYPPTQNEIIKHMAIDFLNRHANIFWPAAIDQNGFRWDWLVDLKNPDAVGVERFDSQFWRANIDPSERYVLSVVNSTQYRMKADESGFENLTLAGDWIRTGLNCGCMEATFMSGMQASRAISGYPRFVSGESDFEFTTGFIEETLGNVVAAGASLWDVTKDVKKGSVKFIQDMARTLQQVREDIF